jgi:DNA primase
MDDFISFKEAVKSRVDIVDVIGEFVELKKRGVTYSAPCPFHNETKPSFNVNRERQFFHCFGCGKGGDVFTFLTAITGMSFMEALEQLAQRAGLEMPRRESFDTGKREAVERIAAANIAAAAYYHKTLYEPAGQAAMEYLAGKRGLTPETIRDFRLGFAPEDPSGLLAAAKEKRVTPADLEAAGIIKTRQYGGVPYHTFGGRAMFPIIDQTARVLGFGGRILEGEGAKYKNSPDSAVYHKSQVLYGIYQAREELKRARTAIIVEGYLDVITLHQAGIKNVIAASGTAFTIEQGRAIARVARNILLLFDGDKAGLAAAARGADNLFETDLNIGVVVLPEGDDPDSFVRREGPDKLRDYFVKPMDIWEFKLKVYHERADSPDERLTLAGEIADSIAHIPDELKREVYIKDLSLKLQIEIDAMRRAVNGRIKRRRKASVAEQTEKPVPGTGDERELLACMLQHLECARQVMNGVGEKPFKTSQVRTIVHGLFNRIDEGMDISPSALMNVVGDPAAQQLITAAMMTERSEERARAFITDYLRFYGIEEVHREHAEVLKQVAREKDAKKKEKLMAHARELLAHLRELTGESSAKTPQK